jgi:hypothetical protein
VPSAEETASLNHPFTTAQVIAMVNLGLNSQNRTTITSTATHWTTRTFPCPLRK